MDPPRQILDLDFGLDAFDNASNGPLAVDWTFGGQQEDVQEMLPVTSLPPQLIGEGNTTQLNSHAKDTSHKSYGCTCGAKFCRLDALTRHVSAQSGGLPQHPCEYCTRHQGTNGFRRHDHLIQHLKDYHRIDVEDKLPKLRTKASPPVATAGAVASMDSSATLQAQVPPFPCNYFGCIKGGVNGYLRQIDLLEHQNMMHPLGIQDYGTVPQFPGNMHFNQDGTFQF
ncbi:hypothetical protein F5Y06DRAFT_307075 [Hypoxylon sp. FL0890]|nr:hypothetical protein F5Y06DRAFT_307075 [Hypoxylon sp. FL0890]